MMGIVKILLQAAHILVPLLMFCTLCLQAAVKVKAVYAHRVRRVVQVIDVRWPIGAAPCLQIRVGRFDSGPRLHHFSFEINNIAPLRGFLLCAFWVLYLEPV